MEITGAPPSGWREQLSGGAAAMALDLDARCEQHLLDYLDLLNKWNRTYNLTAVRDPATMVRRHLLDSLSIARWVDRGPVLDLGTGGGLPGIPLAIVRPDLRFTLLDANGKKTRFVRQAVGELGLVNADVVKSRVEALRAPSRYARITARAFATLADIVASSAHLLADEGRWLAMKGVAPHAELRELPDGYRASIEPLRVPGEIGARHLVVIQRV